ncbi:uncharacterized protein LOC130766205 [Actinidia eriantha]|uniref:uncharacterized protein LOC130766205 n=1 Tax=Actinidia eriantha TaxID=165200 RepID=UPI00258795D9|nr:uncharacterized protein LOC130766205 [Actinidia eriantha]
MAGGLSQNIFIAVVVMPKSRRGERAHNNLDVVWAIAQSSSLEQATTISYYSDICVGAIACRLEKKEGGAVCVYITTLGVLAPYPGLGIAAKLLNHALDLCSKQNIGEIYLHVQTNNEDAINFCKKFGFENTDTIHNYYTNITPPDCYVVTKLINQPQAKK